MTNRSWIDVLEYASVFGSGVGSVAAVVMNQAIYASAPLSFCVLLNLVNRRRLDEATAKSVRTTINHLDSQTNKQSQAIQSLQRQVLALPTPEVLTSVRNEILQEAMQEISHLETDLVSRFGPLEAMDIRPLEQRLLDFQLVYTRFQDSLVELSSRLDELASAQAVKHLEATVTEVVEAHADLSMRFQDLSSTIAVDLTPIHQQLQQFQGQLTALAQQTNPQRFSAETQNLRQEVAALALAMDNLVSRQDLTTVYVEIEKLHQRQKGISQSIEPVKGNLTTLQERLDRLAKDFTLRSEPLQIDALRNALTKLSKGCSALQNQVVQVQTHLAQQMNEQARSATPTTADALDVQAEVQSLVQHLGSITTLVAGLEVAVQQLQKRTEPLPELQEQLTTLQQWAETLDQEREAFQARINLVQHTLEQEQRLFQERIERVTTVLSQEQNILRQQVHAPVSCDNETINQPTMLNADLQTEALRQQQQALANRLATQTEELAQQQQQLAQQLEAKTLDLTQRQQAMQEYLEGMATELDQSQQLLRAELHQVRQELEELPPIAQVAETHAATRLYAVQLEVLTDRVDHLETRVEEIQQTTQRVDLLEGQLAEMQQSAVRLEQLEHQVSEVQQLADRLAVQESPISESQPVSPEDEEEIWDQRVLLELQTILNLNTPLIYAGNNGSQNDSNGNHGLADRPLARSSSPLEEVLGDAQKEVMIAGSWLSHSQISDSILQLLQSALQRGLQIWIGCETLMDSKRIRLPRRIHTRGEGEVEQCLTTPTLRSLQNLQHSYPEQLHLTIQGASEQFLICDRRYAILGRTASQSIDELFSDTEESDASATQTAVAVDLRTSDLETITRLVAAFEASPVANLQPMAYFQRAVMHHELARYPQALEEYNLAIDSNPLDGIAYNNRGLIFYEMEDLNSALLDLNQAIALEHQNPVLYVNRGVIRADLGDREGALADYSIAIQLDADDDVAYNNRGLLLSKMGNKQGAIADYSEAIRLKPHDDVAYFNRGAARSNLNDFAGAIADYSEAIRLNPEFANAYNNRGFARQKMGDRQGAIADFNMALQINPEFANAYNNRGIARTRIGELHLALEDFDRAIAINSRFTNAYNNRGTVKSKLRDFAGAIADFGEALAVNPEFANAYNNRGLAYIDMGRNETAIADLMQAARLFAQQGDEHSSQQALATLKKVQWANRIA